MTEFSSLEVSRALEEQKKEIEDLKKLTIDQKKALDMYNLFTIPAMEKDIQTLREACIEMVKAFNLAPNEWLMTEEVSLAEDKILSALSSTSHNSKEETK